MLGPKAQALAAAEPICEPRPAVKPRKPLRLTRGNKSALATPIRAVAAASLRSALKMSGRRCSKSPGLPMFKALAMAGSCAGLRSTLRFSGRSPSSVAMRLRSRTCSACSCGTLASTAASRASARTTSSSSPTPASRRLTVMALESCWFFRFSRAICSRNCAPRSSP